ncbi:polymer-forming cytoskeletal protein [Roseovarius sp. CAU 1744]|uniref:bactofilin family protein n=1 Tax=Roseovarius sp. CAU 1744 TaxID=3140368 RepID=UPI00325B31BA
MANTIIAEDLVIDGNVRSAEGQIEVKGKVTGDITADAVLVQAGGSTNGKLSAKQITIEGEHEGILQCDDLKLGTASQVHATVHAKTMSAESGVKITGKIKVTG